MSCKKTVEQYIERGADQGYRVDTIDSPCGSTGQHGEWLLCDYCEKNPPVCWGEEGSDW
jgi:hypothetical protein